MRKDKLLILIVFVAVVAAGVAIQQFQQGHTDAEGTRPSGPAGQEYAGGPDDRPVLPPMDVAQFRGISLQLQSSHPEHPYEQYVREIAATGANTINLVVAAYQENCASTSIFIEARKVPTDDQLARVIALSRKLGMRIVLMPIVLLENPKAGEWRGKINPENWDDWWEDYTNYVLHYAYAAQSGKVDVYMVGSELVSTERDHVERWVSLIRQVRKIYKGRLSYSSNWDHYRPITWWKELDIVGMTTYYDLTEGKKPTVETLLANWQPIRKEILDWQAQVGRPILFTEVGWPSQVTGAQYPWDYTRSPDQPDTAAQANCFEAFFRTWINEKAVAGFLVWEWRGHPNQPIGPKDTTYVPCGKPAMDVIRKYLQAPGAKPAVAQAPAASAASSTEPAPASEPAAASDRTVASDPPATQTQPDQR